MGKCKTCKWWRQYLLTDSHNYPFGACAAPKLKESATPSTCEYDEAVYSDYEGYLAKFDTGPEFGCIHHTPAE